MTEEELKEIKADHFENIEELVKTCKMWVTDDDYDAYCRFFDMGAMEEILNLISKQQEIIKNQSYTNKKLRNKIKTVRKERNKLKANIEIKDKVIEKMGKYIKDYDANVYTGEDNWKDTEQIKQYFYLLCIRKN